jgi:hypothetical protein
MCVCLYAVYEADTQVITHTLSCVYYRTQVHTHMSHKCNALFELLN